jgi:hypothetical protein
LKCSKPAASDASKKMKPGESALPISGPVFSDGVNESLNVHTESASRPHKSPSSNEHWKTTTSIWPPSESGVGLVESTPTCPSGWKKRLWMNLTSHIVVLILGSK